MKSYCVQIDSPIPSQYNCVLLTSTDPLKIAKNSFSHRCQAIDEPNAIECVEGDYCINVADSNKCKDLNELNPLLIGRE